MIIRGIKHAFQRPFWGRWNFRVIETYGETISMKILDMICIMIAELVPLAATLFCLMYGFKHFFKKGKPISMQSLTMASRAGEAWQATMRLGRAIGHSAGQHTSRQKQVASLG